METELLSTALGTQKALNNVSYLQRQALREQKL